MPFLPAIGALIGTAIIGTESAIIGTAAALGVTVSATTAVAIAGAVVNTGVAAIEFGALAGVSALLSPKPKVNTAGSPQSFKADPYAPVPMVMGRYGVGGNLIYETTSGGASKAEHGAAGNEFLTQFTVLSGLGPIDGFETLRLDDTVLTFNGQACAGGYIPADYIQAYNPGYSQNGDGSYANNNYADHIWQYAQGGDPNAHVRMEYPSKIQNSNDGLPEWTDLHRLSGFAAAAITRSYDTTVWAGGPGQPQWTLRGVKLYDPRLDSSYPGGAGAQRWPGRAGDRRDYYAAARATWAWSENPILHALNYALGHYFADPATGADPADLNSGRLYAGVGAGFDGVDVDAFVRAANVADANGWRITGQWTTGDGKRSVLVAMLQAGGAQLVSDRGRISCTVSQPRTALNADAPLTWSDLAGAPSLDTTTSVRERYNTAFYRYTSEAHRWQVVQADTPVKAATYVAEDGGVVRSKTLDLEYVPGVDQAAQLAAYALVDGRETPNIVLPGKPHLRGYAVGDCLMVDLPELGLHLAKLVVLKRSTDPSSAIVTLTCRTETDAKHPYALGVSGVAPATPSISGFDPTIVPAPIPASWAADGVAITDPVTGEVVHVVRINGTTIDNVYATQVVVIYAQVTSVDGADVEGAPASEVFAASQEQIDLNLPAGRWHLWLRYITISGAENVENTLDLGIITVGGTTAASTASVPGDATFGDQQKLVSDYIARVDAAGAQLDAIAAKNYDQALTDLQGAEATLNGNVAALFSGQGTLNGEYASLTALVGDANSGLVQKTNVLQSTLGSSSNPAAGTVLARLGTQETATTNLKSQKADATRVSALESEVGDPNSPASGTVYARLHTLETTSAGPDTATAQRLTTLEAEIVANPNLVPDGGMALIASGATNTWGLAQNVAVVTQGIGSFLYCGNGAFVATSAMFPVNANEQLTISARQTRGYSGGEYSLFLQYFRADQVTQSTVKGNSAVVPSPVDNGAPGARQQVTDVAPSDAAFARCYWRGTAQGAAYLAYVKVEAGPTATAFTDTASTQTLNASLKSFVSTTTDALAGKASATAFNLLYAAIQGDDTASAAPALNSRVNNLITAQVDKPGGIASVSALNQVKAAVGGAGNPNILSNGDFGLGTKDWTISYGAVAPASDQGPYLIYNVGSGDRGYASREIARHAPVGVSPNARYSLSARVYSGFIGASSTFARVVIIWLNASGAETGSRASVQTNTQQGFTDLRSDAQNVTITSPAGAASAIIVCDIASASGNVQGSGDNLVYTRIKLEVGAVCTGFSNELVSASVQQQSTALAQLSGYAASSYTVGTDANGIWTGLKLLSASGGTTQPISSAGFYADLFFVQTRSGARLTFTDYQGGTLTVPNLILGTNNLGAGAVTGFYGDTATINYGFPNRGGSPAASTTAPPTSGGGGGTGGYTGTGGGRYPTP